MDFYGYYVMADDLRDDDKNRSPKLWGLLGGPIVQIETAHNLRRDYNSARVPCSFSKIVKDYYGENPRAKALAVHLFKQLTGDDNPKHLEFVMDGAALGGIISQRALYENLLFEEQRNHLAPEDYGFQQDFSERDGGAPLDLEDFKAKIMDNPSLSVHDATRYAEMIENIQRYVSDLSLEVLRLRKSQKKGNALEASVEEPNPVTKQLNLLGITPEKPYGKHGPQLDIDE